jgi:cobalt transporter subunit CbtA
MITRLISSALFAGFTAGLAAALLHLVFIQPLLLEAELYEAGKLVHFGVNGSGVAAGEAAKLLSGPMDWSRDGLTVLFITMIYTSYGLLLVAGFALAESRGITVTARSGLIWGIAVFAALQLAPSFGLAPELPGMSAAGLHHRQLWWYATVTATAGGLALISFGSGRVAWTAAIVLIALPHLVGVPHPEVMQGPTPPELSALFATRSLGASFAACSLLGLAAGYFWQVPQTRSQTA